MLLSRMSCVASVARGEYKRSGTPTAPTAETSSVAGAGTHHERHCSHTLHSGCWRCSTEGRSGPRRAHRRQPSREPPLGPSATSASSSQPLPTSPRGQVVAARCIHRQPQRRRFFAGLTDCAADTIPQGEVPRPPTPSVAAAGTGSGSVQPPFIPPLRDSPGRRFRARRDKGLALNETFGSVCCMSARQVLRIS